jgi:hypothetical protein
MRLPTLVLTVLALGCSEHDPVEVLEDPPPETPCENDIDGTHVCVANTPAYLAAGNVEPGGPSDLFVLARSGYISVVSSAPGSFDVDSFITGISPTQATDRILLCDATMDGRTEIVHDGGEMFANAVVWGKPVDAGWTRETTLPSPLWAATCVDADGDGLLDIVGLSRGNVVTLLGGTGTGFDDVSSREVELPDTALPPEFVGFGEFSGDGVIDMIVVMPDQLEVLTFEGLVDLDEFSGPRAHGLPEMSVTSLLIGDVDGDGYSDLVLGGIGDEEGVIVAMLSRRSGMEVNFESLAAVEVDAVPTHLELADLDLDGRPDVILDDLPNDHFVVVQPRDGAVERVELGAPALDLATGDFDGDGAPDLAILRETEDQVEFRWNDGDGEFG